MFTTGTNTTAFLKYPKAKLSTLHAEAMYVVMYHGMGQFVCRVFENRSISQNCSFWCCKWDFFGHFQTLCVCSSQEQLWLWFTINNMSVNSDFA